MFDCAFHVIVLFPLKESRILNPWILLNWAVNWWFVQWNLFTETIFFWYFFCFTDIWKLYRQEWHFKNYIDKMKNYDSFSKLLSVFNFRKAPLPAWLISQVRDRSINERTEVNLSCCIIILYKVDFYFFVIRFEDSNICFFIWKWDLVVP